jgi:hypothetical protein
MTAGGRWPGFPRAAGSLLCSHMLEACAFTVVGAGAALVLPLPTWARASLAAGCALSAGVLLASGLVHRMLSHRLPGAVDRFLASASAPRRVLAKAGALLLVTWIVRWGAILLMLHSVGIEAGLGTALVYMIVTGLANTAPLLPGNAGVYQALPSAPSPWQACRAPRPPPSLWSLLCTRRSARRSPPSSGSRSTVVASSTSAARPSSASSLRTRRHSDRPSVASGGWRSPLPSGTSRG